jgi:hypothetical protein
MTENNVFAFDHHHQVEKLIEVVGSLDQCKKLGFVVTDEQGILNLSAAGLGFLLYIVTGYASTLPEAFAAGWQAAMDLAKD